MKNLMKHMNKSNWKKTILRGLIICQLLFTFLSFPMISHAEDITFTSETGGELGKTKIVTGTVNLLNDASTVALIIEAALVVILCIVQFIGMQQADDQEKPKYKKNIKSIIITGIIVMTISGILKAVFSYYA